MGEGEWVLRGLRWRLRLGCLQYVGEERWGYHVVVVIIALPTGVCVCVRLHVSQTRTSGEMTFLSARGRRELELLAGHVM